MTGTMLSRLNAARTATLDPVLGANPWHAPAITRSRKRNSSTRVARRVAEGGLPAHRHSASNPVTFAGCARQMLINRCSVGALAAAWLLALATSAFAQSGEHGDGHLQMHDIYQHWRPPLNPGTSCCNDADCRPTRAFVDDHGQWRAWNGSAWLMVPQERVLPTDYAGDGRSHLCEKEGFVYCFTPGEIRG